MSEEQIQARGLATCELIGGVICRGGGEVYSVDTHDRQVDKHGTRPVRQDFFLVISFDLEMSSMFCQPMPYPSCSQLSSTYTPLLGQIREHRIVCLKGPLPEDS